MACDKPISLNESFPLRNTLQKLISAGLVQLSRENLFPNLARLWMLWNFSIRGIGSRVDIMFNEKKIGERQMPQAMEEHDQAIYFLGGEGTDSKTIPREPRE